MVGAKNTRKCWIFSELLLERFRYPLKEELSPIPHPCPLDPLVDIGRLAVAAIDRSYGKGRADEIIDDLLSIGGVDNILALTSQNKGEKGRHLLPVAEPRSGLLGGLMNPLALELPSNP